MYTIMFIGQGTTDNTLSQLKQQYRPAAIVRSASGPSDLVHGRWEKIETDLSEALIKRGEGDKIELVLVGQVGFANNSNPARDDKAHARTVLATTRELKTAKEFAVDLISHKTGGAASVHPVLIIVDYTKREIIKVEDIGA